MIGLNDIQNIDTLVEETSRAKQTYCCVYILCWEDLGSGKGSGSQVVIGATQRAHYPPVREIHNLHNGPTETCTGWLPSPDGRSQS